MIPMTTPASVRTRRSSGGNPARRPSAAAIPVTARVSSSMVLARTSGTSMAMAACWRMSSQSASVSDETASRTAARTAANGVRSAGWRSNASNNRTSKSSRNKTSSLVG